MEDMREAWVHNMSPFLLEFTSGIGVRWYGLAYLAGFALTYYFMDLMARRGTIQLTREQVPDLITYGAIGTMVGGRLGYALFYSPELFTSFHSGFPFWGLLEVNKGGMASHGGIAGIILGIVLYARKNKLSAMHCLDLTTFGGSLGVFFGRIANFINGELYGRPCRSDLWMAVKFPTEIYYWGSQELDKLKNLGPAAQALGEWTHQGGQKMFVTVDQWNAWISSFSYSAQNSIVAVKEALVSATKDHNQAVIQALAPALTPRYPSQLIQAVLEGLVVFLILTCLWRKPRKPGFISALFGILYSIARIIGEEFRLPDHDIGYQALGMTRGQWLTMGMMVFMFIYLYRVIKGPAQPIGGWTKKN